MPNKVTQIKGSPVEMYEDKETLPIKLTQEDKLERGLLIAKNMEEMDGIDKKLSEEKAVAKAELEKLIRHNGMMATELRQGHRYDEVRVEICKDFEAGEVRMTRLDTMEVYECRKMSERERQRDMKF